MRSMHVSCDDMVGYIRASCALFFFDFEKNQITFGCFSHGMTDLVMATGKVDITCGDSGPAFLKLKALYGKMFYFSLFLSALSVVVLKSENGRYAVTGAGSAAEFLLCSSAVTGIVASAVTLMVSFHFDGKSEFAGFDHVAGWIPVGLLDLCLLEFEAGLVCLYCWGNAVGESGGFIGYSLLLALLCAGMSIFIWMKALKS